jgi:hypothetical protein
MIKIDKQLPWPDGYRKLFIEDGGSYEFAHFGWGGFDIQFRGYILGYKESADILIENAIHSKNIATLDTVVFPALFLYRQFLELSLKEFILYFTKGEIEAKITKLNQLNHDLKSMWHEYRKLMPNPENDEQIRTDKAVEKYILEFHEIDKSSFSFRYPITKSLDLIFKNQKRINLKHVKDIMQELSNYFSGVSGYLADLQQNSEI